MDETSSSYLDSNEKDSISSVSVASFGKKADVFFNILVGILSISAIFPFLFVIAVSFTSETSIVLNGYSLIPKSFSLDGYRYLWGLKEEIISAFGVTIFVTVVGTIIQTTVTSAYAYAISRDDFIYKRFFTTLIILTILVGVGLIPSYLVMTRLLKLRNSIWALIVPMAMNPMNAIIMRTFFRRNVPKSIIESAKMDGASEFRVFAQIVVPLAIPGIATISLFAAIGFWNEWFTAMLYITDTRLFPLQFLLTKIQSNLDYIAKNMTSSVQSSGINMPRESTRMAMIVMSVLPIALSYPFFQKYFIRGLTIGGVKE